MIRTRWRRSAVVVAAAAAVLAAGCSKPKGSDQVAASEVEVTTPEISIAGTDTTAAPGGPGATTPGQKAGGPGATTAQGGPGATVPGKPGVTTKTGVTSPKSETGTGELDYARKIGAMVKPQSTQRRKPYYNGITEDTINLAFSYDATGCGVNVVSAITAAGGALPTQTRYYRPAPTTQERVRLDQEESVKLLIDYWNKNAFRTGETMPAIRPLMGNDPERQFFGRKLAYKMVDGGSNQCPDKTTAAARQATDQVKAFSVFNNFDGAQYNMAAALNAMPADRRPMHFGTLWESDQVYSRFAPYAWTQFATGSTITRQLASYVCGKLVGQKASRSPDPAIAGKVRKFGLVHTNNQQDKLLANEFKGQLQAHGCGGAIAREVEYDGKDFAKAQQDNQNLILQLRTSDITSVIMLTEPVQPLFQLQVAQQQRYSPEWIFSSFGYSDSSTVQRLYDQNQVRGSFGTSNLGVGGGFAFGAGDPFSMYHQSHKVAPSGKPCDPTSDAGMDHDPTFCKAPTSLVTWYYTFLPFIGGLLYAGPDPTPQNVSRGLQAYPPSRYGGNGPTEDPRPALVGAGPGKHGFIVDAVEWRWRPEFTSPGPENKKGWVEWPDCQRHYLSWKDPARGGPVYAPQWEPGSKHHAAWCGGKDGYPRTLPEDGLK